MSLMEKSGEQGMPREELINDLQSKLRQLSLPGGRIDLEFIDRRDLFGQKLRKRHPNIIDYQLFHCLIGSSLPGGRPLSDLPEFDLSGDDSIQKFIEDEYEKLSDKTV